jgi:hypothetical protein
LAADSVGGGLESVVTDDLRKEAHLTSGPAASATGRGGEGAARVSWASGRLAGLGPGGKRGGEKWAARDGWRQGPLAALLGWAESQ